MVQYPILEFYAASPRTDTTALPTLLGTDGDSWLRRAVVRCICGNRNSFDVAQITTLSLLNL